MTRLPQLVPFHPFNRGVDAKAEPTFLETGFVADAFNVDFIGGVMRARKGYRIRSKSSAGAIVDGTNFPITGAPVLDLIKMYPGNGATVEIYVTDEFVYTYDYADGSVNSILTTTVPADVPLFGAASSLISWTISPLPKGASTATPTLVLTDGLAIDSTHSIYAWNGFTVNASGANAAAARVLYRISMIGLTDFSFAKQIIWFGDHFMIGDYSAGGSRHRRGIAWGDLNELGIISGGADNAEVILSDSKGFLQRFMLLGSHLAIYFNQSILICDPTPTDDIYAFDPRVRGTGLMGPRAIVDVGGIHIFAGEDNFYTYDGGLRPKPIGNRIIERFFSSVNPSVLEKMVAHHLPRKDMVRFYYASGGTDAHSYIDYMYVDDVWSFGRVAHAITAVGTGVRDIGYRCNSAAFVAKTCVDYGEKACSEYSWQADFDLPTIADKDGNVYDFTDLHLTDNGTAISAFVNTDSKTVGEVYGAEGRVIEIRVEAKGSAFVLFYSTDLGNTWNRISSISDSATFVTTILPVNFFCKFLAFRAEYAITGGSTEIKVISAVMKQTGTRSLSD